MKEFIEYIAKQLVDVPEKVVVDEKQPDKQTIAITLKVDSNDFGKVIGKKGKHAQAMRVLLSAVGAKDDYRATLDILDKE